LGYPWFCGFSHFDQLRAKYQRPRVKVHGAWAFGYTLNVYILDEVAKHDSSAILEILSQTIEDVTGLL
jgi:hypothetical protein